MRLIDADALIQDLIDKKIPFNADVNEAILSARTIGGYADYVDRVWEIAYERGKEEALQWIPCRERLPDKGLRVLMQLDNIWQIVGWYDKEDKQWFELIYEEPVSNDRVLAWMELPPDYKGDIK